MHKVTMSDGTHVECGPELSILTAALKSNVTIPYSCNSGRCSTCEALLLKGDVFDPQSTSIRTKGRIKTCICSPRSDVVLDISPISASLPSQKTLPCKIVSIDLPRPDTAIINLKMPPKSGFNFLPGQHVQVIGLGNVRRSYSIASPRDGGDHITLHVRYVPNGELSEYWFKRARVGDTLRLRGPMGSFFLREKSNAASLIFLATGTGFAPVSSILDTHYRDFIKNNYENIYVFWGARKYEDFYLNLDNKPWRSNVVLVTSRFGYEGCKLGYVQEVALKNQVDLTRAEVYACGSPGMISDSFNLLRSNGLTERRFFSDAFVSTSE